MHLEERVFLQHLTDAIRLAIALNTHDAKIILDFALNEACFLVREGFLCEKLGLPRDIEPEFLDLNDYIDIFELYLDALPSFIY